MAERSTKHRRRARGEGSIYETANGRWRGAVIVTDPATGLRDRRVVSAPTFELARDRLADLKRDVANGVAAKGSSRTLAAYANETWLPGLRLRVRPSTTRAHEQHLKDYVLPALGALKLREITPSAVERLMGTMLAKGRSGSTARAVRTTLGQVLHDAQRDGLIARNVASLARPPRVERRELRILTADETRQVLDGTAGDTMGPLFAVAATTGLRLGELLGLAWPDLELEGATPTLTVRRSLARAAGRNLYALAEPKTNRSRRTIELGSTAARALRRRKARQAAEQLAAGPALWQNVDSLVFTDEIGRPLHPWLVSREFAVALKRLGLPHVRFHDLRHTHVAHLIAAGEQPLLIARRLGHASAAFTQDRYGHLFEEAGSQAAGAVAAMVDGALVTNL